MDQGTERMSVGGAPRATSRATMPRVYYLSPLLAGPLAQWDKLLDHVKTLGFTHVLTAPLFESANIFRPRDFGHTLPVLEWQGSATAALRQFASLARSRDLVPLLDVNLAQIGAPGPLIAEYGALFSRPDLERTLDPRRLTEPPDAAAARFGDEADRLSAFWCEWIRGWSDAGIDGFRLMLQRVPTDFIHAFTQRVRAEGDPLLLGWTPGLSHDTLWRLSGAALDFVFSSLPYWDFESDWLWREADLLARIAPAIAPVEAPFGPRLAASVSDPITLPSVQRRALAFAASFGDGWLMPMGFEWSATRQMDDRHDVVAPIPAEPRLAAEIVTANQPAAAGRARPLGGAGSSPLSFVRAPEDLRFAGHAMLTVINTDLAHRVRVDPIAFLAATEGRFVPTSKEPVELAPGDAHCFALTPSAPVVPVMTRLVETAREAADWGRIGIEKVTPSVDDGRFAAKRLAGELVTVEADILCDGHDKLGVALHWRAVGDAEWQQTRMLPLLNDRWAGSFTLERIGRHEFFIEAWRDAFATFRDELQKKNAAGINVEVELIEGRHQVKDAGASLAELSRKLESLDVAQQVMLLLDAQTSSLMAAADKRPRAVRTLQAYKIDADRGAAAFASWYEIFPRSMSDDPERHGTFRDVIRHLPRIRDMGFDVLYFPPIHPIGKMNRKGRNNSLRAEPGEPGSPYAIGGKEGGHDAIHPELGTFEDFKALREAARTHGLELALDFAIQCSPDHPWLKQHKDWFAWRPDGSMRFAENPPKKYEDIVNVDFYADGAIPGLWVGLCEVVLFWAEQGVRIFRVDNPHTKPFPFWEWLIGEVRARFPDAIFLAEAFTRPKIMGRLGKIGFTQSYTYFTWRNTKREMQEYLTELTTTDTRDFFRPNFFVNTPDINPVFLQTSGRPGYLIRAALAATLAGSWGVYSGYELCEGTPLPGREEYMDSEKYQIRAWDWDRPGNIVTDITMLNRIRRQNPALHSHLGVTFLTAENDQVIFFEKATPDRSNVVLVAVSFDPHGPQSAAVELPLWRWGLPDQASLRATDLARDATFTWTGKRQTITLTPDAPFTIWRTRPTSI